MSFKLISTQALEEIKSIGYLYAHSSGVQLMCIQNDDENKVFSATFKTPAVDDTGVAHIVEHCVLCGSEKYPIKDPFNELAKGSLYTYLNAMTFRDKTIYPIGSCHEKDFYNLMGVYLDAVFFPLVERKEIFMQEGWNFQLNTSREISSYGGIVYSEMKGVYSDPVEQLMLSTYRRLFEGTPYSFDAGGVPERIVDLSYEDFLAFHKQHYQPANCYLYVYGNLDMDKCLAHIDENYLSRFSDRKENHIEIKGGSKVKAIQTEERPEIAFEEASYFYQGCGDTAYKKYLGVSYVMGNVHDNKRLMAMKIVKHYLLDMENSPLKRALNHSKFGRQIFDKLDESIPQPVLSIVVKHTEKSVEQLKTLIDEIIGGILREGLREELLESCINQYEFLLREENYGYKPKGLAYDISMTRDWIYGHDPFSKAYRMRYLEQIKEDKEYLLDTLRMFFLENTNCVCVTLWPSQQEPEGEEAKLAQVKKSLTASEMEEAIADAERLRLFQDKEDDKAEIEKIPMLSLQDIFHVVEVPVVTEHNISRMKVLHCSLESNDIIYLDAMFALSHIPQRLLPYVGVLRYLVGKLGTENYGQDDLSTGINRYFGGFYLSLKTVADAKSEKDYEPKLLLKTKFLKSSIKDAVSYMLEVIQKTLFEDKEQIQRLISELLSKIQGAHSQDGQHVAIHRVKSYLRESFRFEEQIIGLDFYKFLKNMVYTFDDNWDKVYMELKEVYQYIFNQEGIVLTVTCNDEIFKSLQGALYFLENQFYNRLNKGIFAKVSYQLNHEMKNEGIIVSSQVQSVAKALDYSKKGVSFSGHLLVLQSILNGDYLMKEVRLKRGAYGCHVQTLRNGLMVFYSYRDPHLKQTLTAYKNVGQYVRDLKLDQRELEKYILGTINQYLIPKRVAEKSQIAIDQYLRGIDTEDLNREREEILTTTLEQMNSLAFIFDQSLDENYISAVGNEGIILKNRKLFMNTINLL